MIGKIKKIGFYPITVMDAVAIGDGSSRKINDLVFEQIANADVTVKSINHRGYNTGAPENTLPAFILSKKRGFNYVEADVAFTSDNVAVLLHDSTIDRTSNGSGSISEMTYEKVSGYDFGSWYSNEYAGVKIPTFEEFIKLCRNIGLHPYIELKSSASYTSEQLQILVNTVKRYGMKKNVTWISFNIDYLNAINKLDNNLRIGYLAGTVSETTISRVKALDNGFINANYSNLTNEIVQSVMDNDVELEVYTINSLQDLYAINPYISGVTSDVIVAGKELMLQYF